MELKLFPVVCYIGADGKDGNGLKLEIIWPIIPSFHAMSSKS